MTEVEDRPEAAPRACAPVVRIPTLLWCSLVFYIAINVWFAWRLLSPEGPPPLMGQAKSRAEVSEIGKAVGIFLTLTGRMPTSLEDLRRPLAQNAGDSIIDVGEDPWGHPYGLTIDGPSAFTVTCLGADGAPGGEGAGEDIVLHWPPPKDPLPR